MKYSPKILCVSLPGPQWIMVRSVLKKADLEHVMSRNDMDSMLAQHYYDLVIMHSGCGESFIEHEMDNKKFRVPVLNISESHMDRLPDDVEKVLTEEFSPDWSFFETSFPDDEQVMRLLKLEMKREFSHFEENIFTSFKNKDFKNLHKSIHRVQTVCEQLKLYPFLRLFYFCRQIEDFDKAGALEQRMTQMLTLFSRNL